MEEFNNNYPLINPVTVPINMESFIQKTVIPYRCPVCGGNGLVQSGFYSSATGYWTSSSASTTETCRSCFGKGYVLV